MRTKYCHNHKPNCPSFYDTSSSLHPSGLYPSSYLSTTLNASKSINSQHNAYLSGMNFHLLREITDSESEKNFYRHKLTQQFHTHHNQLQIAFKTLSQKNTYIIQLEQDIERVKKDNRVLNDDYVMLKSTVEGDKQNHQLQLESLKKKYEDKIIIMQEEEQKNIQRMVNKRVNEVEQQCDKRVDMFKKSLQQAKQHANQLSHQLKLLQEDYKQVLLKNQTIIQQSIHRQLRKRDFQAQNNYLRDVAQYEHLKKVNQQLKQDLQKQEQQNSQLIGQNKQLKATNQVLITKLADLQEAFEYEKNNNRVILQKQSSKSMTEDVQINTEQNYVPVIFPVDTNLVGEVVSLRDFLIEKLIVQYAQFFSKAALKQHKKAASLITFKNYLNQIRNSKQNSLLLYLHSGLERIVKLYCPAMNYSREYLTVKDEFIRKTLMQCQTIKDTQQKLFRLLELVHRLQNPILTVKSQISTGELKMVEIKVMATLKKIFTTSEQH